MKRKNYKVTVKVKYEITMDHSQTSMLKAKEDVQRVVEDYLENGKDIKNLFDNQKPQTIYKVNIINDKQY